MQGPPAGSTAQQVYLPAPDGACGPLSAVPGAAGATGSRQPPANGGAARSGQQPQMGASHAGYASVAAIPASAASAAASLSLQPAWASGRSLSVPQYTTTPSEMLLQEFSYPSLLPELQQDQPSAYAQQYSLQSLLEVQPTLLPPVRLSIGQQGASFLPAPHMSAMARTDPSSTVATGTLRSPSGSADQRQALRGAALRQALQSGGSFPLQFPSGGTAQPAEQQQASGATVAQNGRAEEPWQRVEQRQPMQLQPPPANAAQQQQQQRSLFDQRKPSSNGNIHTQQPQLAPKDGNTSRRLPSPEQHKTQSSTSTGAGAPAPRADTTASNGALRGTLRSPSSPAKPSLDLPGLEALRRKLRTSSDRRVRR